MANNYNRPANNSNSSSDPVGSDLLTIEGYSKLFEKCEDDSAVFACYKVLSQKKNIKDWMAELKPSDPNNPISRLFEVPFELLPQDNQVKTVHVLNLVQLFSLLENVYRNVLLRPYIPAYRTINTNCGRYRSFIEPLGHDLLKQFNFEYQLPNRYTYKETDQSETIKSAVACSVIIVYFSEKYKDLLKSSSGN